MAKPMSRARPSYPLALMSCGLASKAFAKFVAIVSGRSDAKEISERRRSTYTRWPSLSDLRSDFLCVNLYGRIALCLARICRYGVHSRFNRFAAKIHFDFIMKFRGTAPSDCRLSLPYTGLTPC